MEINLCKSKAEEDKEKLNIITVNSPVKVQSVIPKRRSELMSSNRWGYKASGFEINLDHSCLKFIGDKYPIANTHLPVFTQYLQKTFNLKLDNLMSVGPMSKKVPDPLPCPEFREGLKKFNIDFTDNGEDRLIRSHCQTIRDVVALRNGSYKRISDLVVWPVNHDDVVQIVKLANEYNIVILPIGGNTSASGASSCPQDERRVIAVLDTSQMNSMLWLDKENMIACFESGIIGQDLDRELLKYGVATGHEPDSSEFSTLGGWVATRASGMKKNLYGNIEDILVSVRMVTSKGTIEKSVTAPRISCGPDFDHIILGSEGTLGVITEVVLKLRPMPELKLFGSLVFPDFETGVKCIREIAKRRLQPASIRLLDNEQFHLGRGLQASPTFFGSLVDKSKHFLLTKVKGFDFNKLCVATLVFEGEKNAVLRHEKLVIGIGKSFGALSGGGKNGERGYVLTYVVAYIRDIALDFGIIPESFETACTWGRCLSMAQNIKSTFHRECEVFKIYNRSVTCRVTQSYDAGCVVYFYFAINSDGIKNILDVMEHLMFVLRNEVVASGGSISHHHGIGKSKTQWYPGTVSAVGVKLYKATKKELDPRNIFAIKNILDEEKDQRLAKL